MPYSQSEKISSKSVYEHEQPPMEYEHDKNEINIFHLDHNLNKKKEILNNKAENLKEKDVSGTDPKIPYEFGNNGCEQEEPMQYEQEMNVENIFHLDHAVNKVKEVLNNKAENHQEQNVSGTNPKIPYAFGSNGYEQEQPMQCEQELNVENIFHLDHGVDKVKDCLNNKAENHQEQNVSGTNPKIPYEFGSNGYEQEQPMQCEQGMNVVNIFHLDRTINNEKVVSNQNSNIKFENLNEQQDISGRLLHISDEFSSNGHEQEQPMQYEHKMNGVNIFHLDHTINKEKEVLNQISSNTFENPNVQKDISGSACHLSDEFGSNDSSPLNTSIRKNISNALSALNVDLENKKNDCHKGEPTGLDSFWKCKEIDQVINEIVKKCEHSTVDKCISVAPSTSEKLCQTDISLFERNLCKRKLQFDDCESTKRSKSPYKTDAEEELSKHTSSSDDIFKVDYLKIAEELLNSEDFSVMNNKDIYWSPDTHLESGVMPLISSEEEKEPDEINDDKSLFDEEELEDGQLNWSSAACDSGTDEWDQLVPLPQKETKSVQTEGNYPFAEDEIKLPSFGNNQNSSMASINSNNNTPSNKAHNPVSTRWFSNKLPEDSVNHDCMQVTTSSYNNIAPEFRPDRDYMEASTSSCNNNTVTLNYRRYLDYLVIARSLYYNSSSDESSN